MQDLLANPEIYAQLVELVVGAASLVMTVAGLYLTRFAKVKIEEKHMKVLHEAAVTWAENAMKVGVREASDEAVADLQAYLEKSAPGMMLVLKPGYSVLRMIAGRYLRA